VLKTRTLMHIIFLLESTPILIIEVDNGILGNKSGLSAKTLSCCPYFINKRSGEEDSA
jgi:hypothetical protein